MDAPVTPVSLGYIRWDEERRVLLIEDRIIELTRTEFQIAYPLRYGFPITYAELSWYVYNCRVDTQVRVMLDKHIDRIRGKLHGSGMYIYCVLRYGYVLLAEI